MATPTFDQRPRFFDTYGYRGSRFYQRIRKRGFPPNAPVEVLLYKYNAVGEIDNSPMQLVPTITPVNAENADLVIAGPDTRNLTDPAYYAEYFVSGTVHGTSKMRFGRDVPADLVGKTGDDVIELSAGTSQELVLTNPDVEQGKYFDFRGNPAVHGMFLEHKLNTDLIEAYAFTASGVRRMDVGVIPLRNEAGRDFTMWAYLFLPSVQDASDRVVDLIIKPYYR